MAIVTSPPDAEGKITLYDIPDAELGRYRIDPSAGEKMFPKKESPTRADAVAVVQPKSQGDVQGYAGSVCYYWYCYGGYCWWEWWYC